jgi:hypothetical protein
VSDQLARLKAATWDLEQAIGDLLGTPGTNCHAWRIVKQLIDVYLVSEILWSRNDGQRRKLRDFRKAAKICGVSVTFVYNQRQAARRHAKRK